ncbi:unnamed protein product [Ascophyllum nodosum]
MMIGLSWPAWRHRIEWRKLLVIVSLLAFAGTLAERTMSAGARRRSLEKTRASGSNKAVVVVDDAKFDRYVTGVPRQYEAIVFFTAAAAEFKCQSCRVVHDQFLAVAESYASAKSKKPEVLKGADIYFFVADFSRNQGSFSQVGLQTVPRIVHFPSALAEGEGGRYAVDPSQQMQMMNKVEAEDIARFVKDRTGATVSIVRPEPPVTIILSVLLIVALLSLKPILRNLGALLRVIRNKYMWLALSLMVYTFGISGGVYDIIRNPAPFHFKPDGSIMWFHPQANVQLVAEGFITGFLTLLCGLWGILLVEVAPKLESPRSRQVAVITFGAGFLYFFFNVMKLYRSKNGWYRPIF